MAGAAGRLSPQRLRAGMRARPRVWARVRALAVALLLGAAPAAARDEAALRACLARNLQADAIAQDIAILQRDADGTTRRLDGRWRWQRTADGQRAVLRLSRPQELAGAAYLFIRDRGGETFWMYLPAVGRVRKVVGATVAQSLFGSGLSAFDLKFLFGGLSDGHFERLGEARVGERLVEAWRFIPKPAPDILYDRVDLLIDAEWCLPIDAKLYGGVPWKHLRADLASVSREGPRWRVARYELEDLRSGSRSEIRLGPEDSRASVPADAFDPKQFHRQR